MLDEERRGFEEGLTRKRRERIEGIRVEKKKKKRKKERKKEGYIVLETYTRWKDRMEEIV